MSKEKRELERHSGTGHSIKEGPKRSGGGGHNWGDDVQEMQDAITKHVETEAKEQGAHDDTANKKISEKNPDEPNPENYGDLLTAEKTIPDVSYEEYVNQKQNKGGKKAYDARTVKNDSLTADRYKGKYEYERATDELLQGAQKEKKKRKKKQKSLQTIKPEFSFHPAGRPERDNFRGDSGGYRERGDYDGNRGGSSRGGRRGGGFGGGYGGGRGGFGSRGRGRRNDDSVEENRDDGVPQPHRPQPQYRLKQEQGNVGGDFVASNQTQAPPVNTQ